VLAIQAERHGANGTAGVAACKADGFSVAYRNWRRRPPASSAARQTQAWSLYGAPWLQPVAISGKSDKAEEGSNDRKPLPCVATGCRAERMVNRRSISIPGEKVTSTLLRRRSISL
jgi:hypothetical protein